ncbi:MAG: alkaline phosphatase D [Phycisphaerales bacterium]|jgi:alkaline phosphatase D
MLHTIVAASLMMPVLYEPPQEEAMTRIAFGSCAKEDKPQPIWDVIAADDPDLFLFIGDNMYADIPAVPQSAADIAKAYEQLAAIPEWQRFSENFPVLATWDDHDYGKNDAGEEWFLKEDAQRLFLDFFDVPSDSPRRARQGVYHSEVFGPVGQRVQVILLDTRYHRSPIHETPDWRDAGMNGPYGPGAGGEGTILGEAQWEWLEAQLREPAQVRIVASSIQVVASEHEWEGWYTMPDERQRLFDLIGETDAGGVIMISGDRHLIELSCDRDRGTAYPMWDFTSSGMNQGPRSLDEPNGHRVGPVARDTNYGVISIDWDSPDPVITLEGRDQDGAVILSQLIFLSTLQEK